MSDNLGHDALLIVTTIVFITFVLGLGGGQENNEGENGNEGILPMLINGM